MTSNSGVVNSVGTSGPNDLSTTLLRISVVKYPFTEYDTNVQIEEDGRVTLRPCFGLEMVSALQYAMNFTYILKVANGWGNFNETAGQWNGQILDLLQGKVDLALSSTVDVPSRRRVVEFSHGTQADKLTVVFLQLSLRHDLLALTRPFQPGLWLAIACWWVVGALILLGFQKIPFSSRGRLYLVDGTDRSSFSRITQFSGDFVRIILYGAYSGTLISFLTVALSGYTSFDQLAGSQLSFVVDNYPVIEQATKGVSWPSFRRAYELRLTSIRVSGLHSTKDEVMRGTYVFITDTISAHITLRENFIGTELCSIGAVPLPMETSRLGTMMPKGSIYKRPVDYQLVRAKEFGLNSRWVKRWIPSQPECSQWDPQFDTIPLSSLAVAFVALATGVFISSFALILHCHTCHLRQLGG